MGRQTQFRLASHLAIANRRLIDRTQVVLTAVGGLLGWGAILVVGTPTTLLQIAFPETTSMVLAAGLGIGSVTCFVVADPANFRFMTVQAIFLGYLGVSVCWADYPLDSLTHYLLFLGYWCAGIAAIKLLTQSSLFGLLTILAIFLAALVISSISTADSFFDTAILVFRWLTVPVYLVFLYLVSLWWFASKEARPSHQVLVGLVSVASVVIGGCLLITESATIRIAAFMSFSTLVLLLLRSRLRLSRLPFLFSILVPLSVLLILIWSVVGLGNINWGLSGRVDLWVRGLRNMRDWEVLGFGSGPGGFLSGDLVRNGLFFRDSQWMPSDWHGSAMEVFSTGGLVAIVLFLWVLIDFFRRASQLQEIQNRRFCVAATVFLAIMAITASIIAVPTILSTVTAALLAFPNMIQDSHSSSNLLRC